MPADTPRRTLTLALVLQDVLTATARLRTQRQQSLDANAFRRELIQRLRAARATALQAGYSEQYVDLALYAVTALTDETIMSSRLASFDDWAQKPLGNELFGVHLGGTNFYAQVERLLTLADSEPLADLLEVYQLCILLGFRGKFGSGAAAELHRLTSRMTEKVCRIRGALGPLSPDWLPRDDAPATSRDPLVRRLLIGTAATALLTGGLFFAYHVALGARGDALQTALAGHAP